MFCDVLWHLWFCMGEATWGGHLLRCWIQQWCPGSSFNAQLQAQVQGEIWSRHSWVSYEYLVTQSSHKRVFAEASQLRNTLNKKLTSQRVWSVSEASEKSGFVNAESLWQRLLTWPSCKWLTTKSLYLTKMQSLWVLLFVVKQWLAKWLSQLQGLQGYQIGRIRVTITFFFRPFWHLGLSRILQVVKVEAQRMFLDVGASQASFLCALD